MSSFFVPAILQAATTLDTMATKIWLNNPTLKLKLIYS